jgi:secondary thiamine-phosphate synthase enzyme
MIERLSVRTAKRSELIDITAEVNEVVKKSGVTDGTVTVFCPHTTAGITINENADPTVKSDILGKMERLIEKDDPAFRHMEGNSDSHLKSSFVGASETVIINKGRLVLGTWQSIYFAEFDGPRTREVVVKVLEG